MNVPAAVEMLRQGQVPAFPAEATKRTFAEKLDAQDELRHLRGQFNIPTKSSLRKKALTCKSCERKLQAEAEADGNKRS